MFLFQSKRERGGQFISFETSKNPASSTKEAQKKTEWKKCSSDSTLPPDGEDLTDITSSMTSLLMNEQPQAKQLRYVS